MPVAHKPSPFGSAAASRVFAERHGLMPHEEIADRWFQMSGQRITRGMVFLILRQAEDKLAARLREFADDLQ